MADDIINNDSHDLSKILTDIFSNQELMTKISEAVGSQPNQATSTITDDTQSDAAQNISKLLDNTNIMSKLPEVINLIKPLVSNEKHGGNQINSFDKRLSLLTALKPYLSPKRCEAIDYMVRISKLSETVKGLKL